MELSSIPVTICFCLDEEMWMDDKFCYETKLVALPRIGDKIAPSSSRCKPFIKELEEVFDVDFFDLCWVVDDVFFDDMFTKQVYIQIITIEMKEQRNRRR